MPELHVFDMLAKAFTAEGCKVLFTLMGDGNMYMAESLSRLPGTTLVHARHEQCAVGMADGYARATGTVGVASTTCGPGFTQVMTALVSAARGNVPLVVFAGDSPQSAPWYIQELDLGPLARATGARYIPIRTVDRALDNVREAFQVAALERTPVVLSAPIDLQNQPWPYTDDYVPSSEYLPIAQRPEPDPRLIDRVVAMIKESKKPIVIAGRGARFSGAGAAIEKLAETLGALLATSLQAKGLFEGNPFALDVAGVFASDFARERFVEADLVLGFGVGLGAFTTESGYLYPEARTVQVDINPRGLWQGLRTADLHIRADARATAEILTERLAHEGTSRPGFRSKELAAQIAADSPDRKQFQIDPGTVDPRQAIQEIDRVIPKDWDIVTGVGHFFGMTTTFLRGRAADKYHYLSDFGAIGTGLPGAIGVAVARNNGKVLLIEGDGSLLMHIQELETIHRQGIRLLIAVINDGEYGAESQKFRAHGMDPKTVIFGRGDLAAVARGFGIPGATVSKLGTMDGLFGDYLGSGGAGLWDIRSDDKVVSRAYRRIHYAEA